VAEAAPDFYNDEKINNQNIGGKKMDYFNIEKEFRCHDGSEIPADAKSNLTALVGVVMNPARERFGRPIHINSGYRTEAYNRKIGGAANSQHCKGQACDCCATHEGYSCMQDWKKANLEIARAIVKGGNWDQMILYVDNNGALLPRFVHVSWKRNGANRREVRKKVVGGAPIYPKLTEDEMARLKG
jgi:hypothetical protein